VPTLELPDVGGDPFGGLDLPMPTAGKPVVADGAPAPSGVVSFKPADKAAAAPMHAPGGSSAGIDLDLESATARQRANADPRAPKAAPRAKEEAVAAKPAKPGISRRARQILAAAGIAVVLASGTGFVLYRRWQKQQHHAAELDDALGEARAGLADAKPGHWMMASGAAQAALALEPTNPDALGIAALGLYAAALDDGVDAKARTTQADGFLQQLITTGSLGDPAEKAQALKSIIEEQPARALERLQPVLARAPGDPDALLFAGWAQLAARAWTPAVAAFDKALAAAPNRPVPALYGRAQAKLALGDLAGARADFDAVLAKERDHIGAQVGQAAAAPPGELEARESQLVGLLQRKDLATADPRAVVRAWVLAGDAARQAGRVDAAAERYKKALELSPDDPGALLGQAQVLARNGALEPAADAAARVLARAPDSIDAALVAAEIALQRNHPDDAQKLVDGLSNRTPPVDAPLQKSRLLVLSGKLFAAQAGHEEDALTAFAQARTLGVEGDITPTLAAANLLGKMVAAAIKDKRTADADALRRRADDLLAPLEARAQTDAAMAVTLGVAYMASDSPARAEQWLQAAVDKRPNDIEALFQLAEAQARGNKPDQALATRRRAFDLDPTRADIGLSLAREYEDANRNDDATAMYQKLVKPSDASLDARARAGRFWARLGQIDDARAQGELIRAADPNNPAGLYLVAEGLLKDKKLDLARRTFQQAIDGDAQPSAQYLDGLGRADEALAGQTEDTRFQEDALRTYTLATKADAKMFNPWAGRGRILLARSDWPRAIEALTAANALRPGDGDVMFGLGVAQQEQQHDQDALTWLGRSISAKPRAEAYYRMGLIYFDRDQPGQAVAALTSATNLAVADEKATGVQVPWLTEAFFRLGDIEDSRNNLGPAAHAWRVYLARNPSNSAQVAEVRQRMKGLPGGP
jgi:tetratricopeptide (TPR) repeat protein